MTQVSFPKMAYRQINSQYHNSSGSEVYIHKVDIAFKQLENLQKNHLMTSEASDKPITSLTLTLFESTGGVPVDVFSGLFN